MTNIFLTYTVGLPGSGKSTWARDMQIPGSTFLVSRDDVRAMLSYQTEWTGSFEKTVVIIFIEIITTLLLKGKNVIVHDTNLSASSVARLQRIVDTVNSEYKKQGKDISVLLVEKSFLDVPLEECIRRDRIRDKSVGESVIRKMYYQYLAPPVQTDYDEVALLPHAYVFDIDGTLAIKGDRNPYDWKNVGLDSLNERVNQVRESLYNNGFKILIFSGRDSICRKETEDWLTSNGVNYHALYMRPEGNGEKDFVVKYRMYEEASLLYNILGIFDDRTQVTNMWKEKGIFVFDVGQGRADF